MIKKSVFENDLITGMQQELRKQASGEQPDLIKAGECLHAALEILEDAGLQTHADQLLMAMKKIAGRKPKRPDTIHDVHTQGLTPAKMVKNLKHHGTEFDMPDLAWADFETEFADMLDAQGTEINIEDLLDADVDDTLSASDPEMLEDFEDEVHSADDKKETTKESTEESKPKKYEPGSMRCMGCGKRMALCDCVKAFPVKRVKR